jgi:hypothetical protein
LTSLTVDDIKALLKDENVKYPTQNGKAMTKPDAVLYLA